MITQSTRLADVRIRRPAVHWIAIFTMVSWLGEYVLPLSFLPFSPEKTVQHYLIKCTILVRRRPAGPARLGDTATAWCPTLKTLDIERIIAVRSFWCGILISILPPQFGVTAKAFSTAAKELPN